jgi:hypothetical protein
VQSVRTVGSGFTRLAGGGVLCGCLNHLSVGR